MTREFSVMEQETRELIPLFEAAYGKDHPEVGDIHRLRGIALYNLQRYPEAEVELREAVRIGEARLAPSPALATLLYNVGAVFVQLEQPAVGRPFMLRALAMARATLPAGDGRLATFLTGIAATSEDDADVEKGFTEAAAILERGPRPNITLASTLSNLGTLEQEHRKFDAALAFYERSVKEHEGMRAADQTQLAMVRISIAACQIALARFPAALESSARAITEARHPVIQNQARYAHGTARVRAGDAGGRAEVSAALAELKKLDAPPPKL
jgi:tetratricopeptide (TPR) repeat protein